MRTEDVVARLEAIGNPGAALGMARYGITANKVYGVSIPNLRNLAKEIGTDSGLARRLWLENSRETRILASMIYAPCELSEELMDRWVKDFDSWEVCDQCCANLFEKHPSAYAKCREWSSRWEEYVKRAGFTLMARLAVSDKTADDAHFEQFFPIIIREAQDSRNYVKKAINWALRQIGKRNLALNRAAIAAAEVIRERDSKSARWVANAALRELTSEAVQSRLRP